MLELQNFLRTNFGDRLRLSSEYGVYSKQHNQYPNLYQFTYDQIESSKIKDHPIVRESRGIILDRDASWSVVARPFDRFFNWGENVDEVNFDWSSFVSQEKIDGSLMILYNHLGKWNVATKGSPDANGTVGDNRFTFAELFWETFKQQMYSVSDLNPRNTYMFELTSKFNRVVTSQFNNEGKLTLIGVRDIETGQEFPVSLYKDIFDVVRSYDMNTIDEILLAAKELDPSKQEGFVLVDKNYNRIKVKSEKYVLIHHLKDSIDDERIVELIRTGEDSEVFAYFPDIKNRYDTIKKSVDTTIAFLDLFWKFYIDENINMSKISQKEFALYVQDVFDEKIHSFFYMRRAGKVQNASEWMNKLRPEKVLDVSNVSKNGE
jgi:T4 RnlA family RNA ligase